MELNAIKRDVDALALIDDGAWVSDIPELGGVRLKVRGLQSKVVASTYARKERAAPKEDRERDGKTLTRDASLRISREVLHEAILLDWDGFTDGGKPVKYSAQLAAGLCTDPQYKAFADGVAWAAGVVDAGNADKTEEIAGN